MTVTKKGGNEKHPAARHLRNLKSWLLARQIEVSEKETPPGAIPVIEAEDRLSLEKDEGDNSVGAFTGDDSAMFDLLQFFMDAIKNHPGEKDRFFNVIQKMMDPNASSVLSQSDIKFMLGLIDEGLFLMEE